MAYASKGDQRLEGSTNYKGSASTLTSDSVQEASSMGKSPEKVWGKVGSGTPAKIYGKVQSKSTEAKITGRIGGKKGK